MLNRLGAIGVAAAMLACGSDSTVNRGGDAATDASGGTAGQASGSGGNAAADGGTTGNNGGGTAAPGAPNIVLIFVDDLGYGDLGSYGNDTIRTPELDRMASEGQRWTDFYVSASICTPSRAGLLTGRHHRRTGVYGTDHPAYDEHSTTGLPASEVTMAELLRDNGYTTSIVGKWHLGQQQEHLPPNHGFDHWYGIPYSHNISPPTLPLYRNDEQVERNPRAALLTKNFTDEAITFIKENGNKDKPFFLYLAHPMPHIPVDATNDFTRGRQMDPPNPYLDAVEELDWGVGQVLQTLRDEGIHEDTLVVFLSDNGPWTSCNTTLPYCKAGPEDNRWIIAGTAKPLTGEKFGAEEGGMRVPAIFWWPETIAPDTVSELGSALDLLPTFVALAGAEPPADVVLDGYDIGPALRGTGPSPRETVAYFRLREFNVAFRRGKYKVYPNDGRFYDLSVDPSESNDISGEESDLASELIQASRDYVATVPRAEPIVD